jgi:hypothetical protein
MICSFCRNVEEFDIVLIESPEGGRWPYGLESGFSFLHTEREKLERVIASLEELQAITSNTQSPLRGEEGVDLGERERR